MRPSFRFPFRSRSQIQRDLDDEIALHIDLRAAELVATRRLTHADARAEATREFGDVDFTRRYCLDLDTASERMTRRTEWLDDLRIDLRQSLRTLRRSSAFTAVALITLALGVGVTTAMYSVLQRTLLVELPYTEPDRVVRIYGRNEMNPRGQLAAGDAIDIRASQRAFTSVAAFAGAGFTYTGGSEPRRLTGLRIATDMFAVLGARPLHGRGFLPDDAVPEVPQVVVLSHRVFQEVFGGDPAIVGRKITLNDVPRTVVGVMPPGFFIEQRDVDVWAPLNFSNVAADANRIRKYRFLGMVGRLRPDATLEQGKADLATIASRLEREYPEGNTGVSFDAMPVRTWLVGEMRKPLLILAGAAAMVLLIACANVASLLLTRTIARRQELGIRSALGAGRGRIVRQLLTESSVLAVAGGVLGFVIAYATSTMLATLVGERYAPVASATRLDPTLLVIALATALGTVVLFGVWPAVAGSRPDLRGALSDTTRSTTGGHARHRARSVLVVAQATLAVVLLIGAGLLIRSLHHLQRLELGFQTSQMLTFRINLPSGRYDSREKGNQFFDDLVVRLRALPGVDAAGTTGIMPLRGGASASLAIRGREVPEGQLPEVGYVTASRGYFETMRIPLRRGRVFDQRDDATSPLVVVVNESVARQHWPTGDAVGARVRLGPDPSEPWAEVIGIVGDVRQGGAAGVTRPAIYVFDLQDYWDGRDVVVRARGEATAIAAAVRRVVRDLDPNLPLIEMRTMDAAAAENLSGQRLSMALMTGFATLALLLAAVGLFGVMSYVVTARTREFGVRMALGATQRGVLALVIRQGVGTAGVGLVLGLVCAAAATRLLVTFLHGVRPLDPLTFATVPAVLLVVAMLACWLPARRATRVDPIAALRSE